MHKLVAAILFLCLACVGTHAQQRQVVLELLLAIDTSASVDVEEFELQRAGLADAFAHPDLIAIIESMGRKGIAVSLLEWSGEKQQDVIVDWMLVNDTHSSLKLSNQIRNVPRAFSGLTDIGNAIKVSANSIFQNQFSGARKVIDVSGDGVTNSGDPGKERDRAVSQGIIINGLVIVDEQTKGKPGEEEEIMEHYSTYVIGGDGAFLMNAQGFEDFREAILKKLIREIIGQHTAKATAIIMKN